MSDLEKAAFKAMVPPLVDLCYEVAAIAANEAVRQQWHTRAERITTLAGLAGLI